MAWADKYANFDLATGDNDGSSEANAWQTPAAVIAGVAAGNRVNIKRQSAAYNLTASVTFDDSGTAAAPIWYRAYTTTIGDGGFWEVAYNTAGTANLIFSGNYNIVEGVHFKPGASTNANGFSVSGILSWAIRCKGVVKGASNFTNMLRCHLVQTTAGAGFSKGAVATANSNWLDSYIGRTGSTSVTQLINLDTYGAVINIAGCVIVGISGENAFFLDRANDCRGMWISGNRFYNFDSALVVDEEPNADREQILIANNLFHTMATYGVERVNADGGFVQIVNNYYRSCTSGLTNYSDEAQFGNVALSADAFTDAANKKFTLNRTANGGQVLRDAQFAIDPTDATAMIVEPFGTMWPEPVVPAVGDVQKDVVFGELSALTGTLELPAVGWVEENVSYGAAGTEFDGTLVLPAEANVADGVTYGYNSAVNHDADSAGNLVSPAEADVKAGVTYGPGGATLEGTLVGGGGNVIVIDD